MVKLHLKDFKLFKDKKYLCGPLPKPDPIYFYPSARFKCDEFPEVKGFVNEVFMVMEGMEHAYGFKLEVGQWFGCIHIEEGWETLESGKVTEFYLREFQPSDAPPRVAKETVLPPGTRLVYEKFHKINKPHELSSFDIDVRGGSTDGAGKNEHGAPHFHILEKRTRKDLGKVEFPNVELWRLASDKETVLDLSKASISRSQKKEVIDWLEKDDQKNLELLMSEWNSRNKHNNRIIK